MQDVSGIMKEQQYAAVLSKKKKKVVATANAAVGLGRGGGPLIAVTACTHHAKAPSHESLEAGRRTAAEYYS